MFKTMCLIREFEEAAHQSFVEGFSAGSIHQSIGQEAVAVGVCTNMRPTDMIHSNHRGHGHAIAKGADVTAMMKELFGRVGGTSGGKGGSMHIADFSVGMLGARAGPTAGGSAVPTTFRTASGTSGSVNTHVALLNTVRARVVSRPGSPGPEPTNVMRPGLSFRPRPLP